MECLKRHKRDGDVARDDSSPFMLSTTDASRGPEGEYMSFRSDRRLHVWLRELANTGDEGRLLSRVLVLALVEPVLKVFGNPFIGIVFGLEPRHVLERPVRELGMYAPCAAI